MTVLLGAILAFVLIGLLARRPGGSSYGAIAIVAAAVASLYLLAPWLM